MSLRELRRLRLRVILAQDLVRAEVMTRGVEPYLRGDNSLVVYELCAIIMLINTRLRHR
jgi:hypothetical protein